MLVNGPLPVSPNDSVGRIDSTFRPYQRVVAEVLQVTATQAILSIDGTTIVARLTSLDQAAALKDQRMARFIVTQANENTINFKLIQPNQTGSLDTTGMRQDLLGRFLAELNLMASAKNITLVESMLNQRLPLTPELFNELNTVLAQFGDWGTDLADLAAAIKSAGLPLTRDSLALAARDGQGSEALNNLYQMMKEALGRANLPDGFRSLLETAVRLFDEARANPSAPRFELAKALENQIQLNGRSLENILLEHTGKENPFWPEKSLTILTRLHTLAERMGERELSQDISKYLQQTQQNQFWNIHTGRPQVAEEWLEIPLYLQIPTNKGEEQAQQARLRIMRKPHESGEKIDPLNTRLIIEMEVAPGQTVQVNLSLTGKQARTDVLVEDEKILEFADLEFPALEEAMQSLGYALVQNSLRVGKPEAPISPHHPSDHGVVTLTVDLEV